MSPPRWISSGTPGRGASRSTSARSRAPEIRVPFLVLTLLCVAASADADPTGARALLDRALEARDAAGIDAALQADTSRRSFHLALRLPAYAVLSRFAPTSEAAREILRRSVAGAVRGQPEPAADDLPLMARIARLRGTVDAEGAGELAEIGDPRAIPALREALDPVMPRGALSAKRIAIDWMRLTEHHPRARGRSAAWLWLELARNTYEGRYERGEASVLYDWYGEPRTREVRPELYEYWLAKRAVDRALSLEPELLEAKAFALRLEAARALTEEAMAAAGSASFSAAAPPPEIEDGGLALAVALQDARAAGEHEIAAWLLGLAEERGALPEIARSLTEEDELVRGAALEALSRFDATGPMSDEEVSAFLEGTRSADAGVSDAAVQMLTGASLSPGQREDLLRSLPPEAETPAVDREPKLVTVFYGTDRAEVTPDAAYYLTKYLPAAAALLFALLIGPVVRFLFHPRFHALGRYAKYALLAGCLMFLILGAYGSVRTAKRHARLGVEYGGSRGPFDSPDGPYCHFGTCVVGIPPGHEVGEVERPGLLSGELWEDPEEHVMLLTIQPRKKDEFFRELAGAGREKAFVFVHGFNVAFDDAALRTAQMAHDLEYDGAPIFFSWPSRAQVVAYTVDESTVAWATRHLKDFLRDVRRALPDATIHLVAHSMGNRALTEALRRLAVEVEAEELPRFQEVVLAAPDIDAATFKEDIAPAIRPAAERVTMYASAYDRALAASKEVHGYPRAGDAAGGVVTVRGVQSIEVDVKDLDLLGHSYYGSAGHMIDDLVALLLFRRHPEQRGLERVGAFWRLR